MTALLTRDAATFPRVSVRVAEVVGSQPGATPLRPHAVGALYDGSPGSGAALAPACALAARLDAELVLIQAGTPGIGTGGSTDSTVQEAVAAARAQGLRARALQVDAPRDPTAAAIAAAVIEGVRETGTGLLVLSTQAAVGPEDATTEAIAAQSHLPLLLVPPRYGSRTWDGATQWIGWDAAALAAGRAGYPSAPLRLLVALSGSPAAERTLPLAAGLAQWVGAQLSLVRVVPSNSALYCPENGQRGTIDNGLDYLQRVALRLQAGGVRPDAVRIAVRVGDAAETLLSQAVREQAAILMLAAPARRGTAPGMGSRVTAPLLRRAPLPVLMVPDATDVGGQT